MISLGRLSLFEIVDQQSTTLTKNPSMVDVDMTIYHDVNLFSCLTNISAAKYILMFLIIVTKQL